MQTKRRRLDAAQFIVLIGVIASIFGIVAYLSGLQSLPEVITFLTGNRATATYTAMPSTPTLDKPLDQLLTGTALIYIDDFSSTFRSSFNFRLGETASGNTPADLVLTNCRVSSPFFNLYCELIGTEIWNVGNVHLRVISDRGSRGVDVLPDEKLEVGQSYVLQSYDGHPVKFRVSNLEIFYEGEVPISVNLVIEYVYQTNNRDDFLGP